nr:hypothetical protein [Solibacillus sp. R5-41]
MIIVPCENTEDICQVIHLAFERYKEDPIPSSTLVETPQTIEKELQKGIRVWGGRINEQLVAIVKIVTQADALHFSRLSVFQLCKEKDLQSSLFALLKCKQKWKGSAMLHAKFEAVRKGIFNFIVRLDSI